MPQRDYLYSKKDLAAMQAWPLQKKIQVTQTRLFEWWLRYEGKIYISFSGGKDSTVLADLAARMYKANSNLHTDRGPDPLTLVFVDTGLEYPEIRSFAKEFAQWIRDTYEIKVDFIVRRPEMTFPAVLTEYGYPIISKEVAKRIYYARKGKTWAIRSMAGEEKDGTKSKYKARYIKYSKLLEAPFPISSYCCDVMKKRPAHKYERETGRVPVVGTMAQESQQREDGWRRTGCNSFENGKSQPMSFWTDQDVLLYLKLTGIPYATIYGEIITKDPQISIFDNTEPGTLITTGCERTGCMFCMFGITRDREPNRFQRMRLTHPRQYDFCINGGHYENGVLKPDKNGLGIGKVLDYIGKPY